MNNYMKVIINALKQWTTNKLSIVDQALENKVDKVEGKGLSTEDFTTEYKEKLDSLTPDSGDIEAIAKDAVLYIEQSLTNEQKAQARENIGVNDEISSALLSLDLIRPLSDEDGSLADFEEALLAARNNDIFLPEVTTENDGGVLKVVDGKWRVGQVDIPEMPEINYPVTSVNGQTGDVVLDEYETKTDASAKLTEAKEYTDTAVANLVNSAPETLDTLGELATAFKENADMVAALDAAITNKADKGELFSGSWNDLEDKPFYDTDPTYETIVENVEVAMTAAPEESGNYSTGTIVEYADSDMLVAGERYKIVINDVEYFGVGECAYDASRKYGGLGSIPEELLPYVKDMKSDIVAILGDDKPFAIQYYTPESEKALGNYEDNYEFGRLRIQHDAPVDSVITLSIYRVVSDTKKIDIKYLNKPDWNQFDNNADDYIKNKPFERMENEEVLIFDKTVSFSAGDSSSDQFENIFTESEMSINNTFIVVWDGTRYECRAWYRGLSEVYLGNIQFRFNLYPITSDLPFCIEGGFGDAYGIRFYLVNTPQSEETHTVQIYKIAPSWACAEEFLPFIHGDWEENNFSSPNYIANRPFHRELYEDRAIISSMARTYVGMGSGIYVTTAQMSYQPILGKTYKSRFGAKTADFTTSICKATYFHTEGEAQYVNYCGNLSMFMPNKEDTGEDHLVMFNCNLLTNEFMLGTATIICKNSSDTYSSILRGPSYDYHTLDVNYLPSEIARKTDILQSDWSQNDEGAVDFVKNRTHYVADGTIYYGGTTSTDSITVNEKQYYKPRQGDYMLKMSALIGGSVRFYSDGNYFSGEITESQVVVGDGAEMYGNAVIIVRNVNFSLNGVSYVAPSTGIYFVRESSYFYAYDLTYKIPKPLDEKFIPSTIARVSDIPDINAPKNEFILNSSTEGSTKQFKITIDDTGTLTISEIVKEVE